MTISTINEFTTEIEKAISSSASYLEPEELEFAATQALRELGFSLPIDNKKKEYWCIERGKRHALDILRTVSAHKFKYKQLSLNQRFTHYDALINKMDSDFEKALNSDPDLLDIDMTQFFGVYLGNNMIYNQFGEDVSKELGYYEIDNEGFREYPYNT